MIRALVLVALSLGACKGGNAPAGGPAPVKLQLNWKPEPQFGGFYAARETGAYGRHGLVVDVVAGGVGTPTVQMIGAGRVEFGVVGADEIVAARAAGNDVVGLFAVYQTCPQGLMVRAARGLEQIGDIFAQPGTVAMQRGLPYAQFLERRYGFGKVKIVPSPGGDVSVFLADPAFAQQCFVTSEPLVARKAGVEPKTFLVAEAGFNPYTTVLATSGDFARKHPELVRAMVAAVREGWRAYLDDPAPAHVVMHRLNPAMPLATFAESAAAQRPLIETEETRRAGLGVMTLERWQTLAQQLLELKVIDKPVDPKSCFQ